MSGRGWEMMSGDTALVFDRLVGEQTRRIEWNRPIHRGVREAADHKSRMVRCSLGLVDVDRARRMAFRGISSVVQIRSSVGSLKATRYENRADKRLEPIQWNEQKIDVQDCQEDSIEWVMKGSVAFACSSWDYRGNRPPI